MGRHRDMSWCQTSSGLSTSHAAWDVDAVHGVHAMYSVSKLGTARGSDLPMSFNPLNGLTLQWALLVPWESG